MDTELRNDFLFCFTRQCHSRTDTPRRLVLIVKYCNRIALLRSTTQTRPFSAIPANFPLLRRVIEMKGRRMLPDAATLPGRYGRAESGRPHPSRRNLLAA